MKPKQRAQPKKDAPAARFRVTSKVTSKWQITVPKAVREELGLETGQDLVFIGTPAGVLVQRRVDLPPLEEWHRFFEGLTGRDVDELIEEWRGR